MKSPENSKTVLVCPLAWGIGHTSRMIPVIKELTARGHNVIFGGNEWQSDFIRREIQGISCIHFPGFSIRYSRFLPQYLTILLHAPSFFYHSLREHFFLKKIIRKYNISIVISDSRTGLWNKRITSVLFTHIIRIPFPGLLTCFENLFLPLSRYAIEKFTYCFIPDLPGEINLSGRLSHNLRLPANARYTGVLQSFSEAACKGQKKEFLCTAIMSGPSPQKEIFAGLCKKVLSECRGISVIVEGSISSGFTERTEGNLRIVNHLSRNELINVINRSEIIVSRSGYTTIMELFGAGRSAILVPTPGQPEQEYLAKYLSGKKWFIAVKQNNFKNGLLNLIGETFLPPFPAYENKKLFADAMDELLK